MSLSPFDSFQSRFVTYLLNFPRRILHSQSLSDVFVNQILEGSALKQITVISYPICCQFAVHMKRQSGLKYLHQGDSISGVRELSTRDLWHWSDIIIEESALNIAHYVTISQSQGRALPPFKLLQVGTKKWTDGKDAELMLFFEGCINLQAPCVLYMGQVFRYSPENAFCIFNQQIYFIIRYLLERASLM